MQKKTVPYEILIRYDENGNFSGASKTVCEMIIDDDGITILSRTIVGPVPYALPSDSEFVTVLGQALSDSLSAYSQLKTNFLTLQSKTSHSQPA